MFTTAFLFGLISSLHCIGMCGAIAIMLPIAKKNKTQRFLQTTTYHLGRLTAYGFIGLIFGLLGKGLFLAGIQQKLTIIIGLLIILTVVLPKKVHTNNPFSKYSYKIVGKLKSILGKQFKNKSYKSLYIIGLTNGFLPCGMVYVALFGAIAMQNAFLGSFYMILFGLGTIPLMSSVFFLQSYITVDFRNKIQKTIPYFVILIGILFILRGLGLGIPYISPANVSLFVKASPNCH